MKLSDSRSDSWFKILRSIQRGDRPEDEDLHAAFLRGEQLSAEQQRIIAKLFDGSLKKARGRPKNREVDKALAKLRAQQNDLCFYLFVTEIAEDLRKEGASDPLEEALRQATAEAKRGGIATIRRRYARGKAQAVPE